MKVHIELTEKDLRQLIMTHVHEVMGDSFIVDEKDVTR